MILQTYQSSPGPERWGDCCSTRWRCDV